MTLREACQIINGQRRQFRKLNNIRFTTGKFEYRIRYEGGFAEFFCLDRRQIGKRNFKYFHGFSGVNMPTAKDVMTYATNVVTRRELDAQR